MQLRCLLTCSIALGMLAPCGFPNSAYGCGRRTADPCPLSSGDPVRTCANFEHKLSAQRKWLPPDNLTGARVSPISSAVSASSTAQSRNCAITAGSIEVLARSQQHLARFLSSCGSRICLLPRKHMQASQERATPRYRYFLNSHFSPKFRPKGSSKIRPSQAKAVCLLLSGTGASGSVASSRFAAPARFGLSGSGH